MSQQYKIKACDNCYRHKKRCGGELPCANCARLNKTCEYTGKDRPTARPHISRTSTKSDSSYGESRANSTLQPTSEGNEDESTQSIQTQFDNMLDFDALRIENSYPINPLLRQQFEERFNVVPNFYLNAQQLRDAPEMTKLAVYALVARDKEYSHIASHRQLYNEARRQLRDLMDDEPKIYINTNEVILTWNLLSYYEFSNELFYRSWLSIGHMTRLITVDAMYLLDYPYGSPWKERKGPDLQRARVVFWQVFLMDRIASWTTAFSPGLTAGDIRTNLCDVNGVDTGYNLQDDWSGAQLPVFAYIMIAANLWEDNEKLFKACFHADKGLLSGDEIRKRFLARLRSIFNLRDQSRSDLTPSNNNELFANVVLQLILQSAIVQLCDKAIDNDLPYHGELKLAAFRVFLQLGSIDVELGTYNAILTHTLFKAGLALSRLYKATGTADANNSELIHGLTVIIAMLENLATTDPGAANFVKQLKSSMSGDTVAQTVSELVCDGVRIELKQMGQPDVDMLGMEEIQNLQTMLNQMTDREHGRL